MMSPVATPIVSTGELRHSIASPVTTPIVYSGERHLPVGAVKLIVDAVKLGETGDEVQVVDLRVLLFRSAHLLR